MKAAGATRRTTFANAVAASYDAGTMRPDRILRPLLVTVVTAAAVVAWREPVPQGDAPALWTALKPGPHRVGYRRIPSNGSVIHAWYPTTGSGTAVRFRDYLGVDTARLASFLSQTGLPRATVDSLFASALHAIASPPSLNQTFPLVLIAQGNGQDVIDQVVLCEYLASQGFVVAATPSPMLRTPMQREDQVGELAETQASDLASAITDVARQFMIHDKRIGVVGHSFGARAALLLAMRDPRIAAMVSLDGGIGTATAVEPFRRAPSFRAEAPLPPLLHFYEELDGFMTPDFSSLRSLRTSELALERTVGMHHVHFTTYGFVASVFPAVGAMTRADSSTARSVVGVAEQTATFLRRHLR